VIAPFDIFRTAKDGQLMWCGTAASLDEAKTKVHELMASEKTDYVIFSQKTGNRLVVQAEPDGERARKS
jgi:hypothetical protein